MNCNKYFLSPFRQFFALSLFMMLAVGISAQDEAHEGGGEHHRGLQKVGNTFESVWLIDNQTVLVPLKKTAEFDILHRFGTVKNGYDDFWGLYAPSNIRLGVSYVPIKNLMLGVGITKERFLWDYNLKYSILREQGEKTFPVSVTYFGSLAVDTRNASNFRKHEDRYSYFHQLMVARKVNRDFSVQASLNLSHFNFVEAFINDENEVVGKMKNDHYSISVMGRYKVSDAFAFIANYDQPITNHLENNPKPNISFGVEVATVLHAFQGFIGSYKSIVPQYNNVFNQNDFADGGFLLGFNITRLFDLEMENMKDMLFSRKAKKKAKKEGKE